MMPIAHITSIIRDGCEPLVRVLNLRGPTIEEDNTCTRLGYFGSTIGVEIRAEFDYFFVFGVPFRMSNKGDSLVDGLLDDYSRVRKMYLQEALNKLRIPYKNEDAEMKRLGGNYRNCEAMTKVLASLIERTWSEIDKHAGELFPV